jgi:5-methylcytosine-specific restriction endonuclease McrBC regulatory subunit McrC
MARYGVATVMYNASLIASFPHDSLAENSQEIVERVLTWLRGELPGYTFDGLEELGQIDVPSEVVPPGNGEILDKLFPPANLLQLKVQRRFTGDKLEGYRLCASGRVGIAAVSDRDSELPSATITVRPKIPAASLLTMLSYALVPELSAEQRAQIDASDTQTVSLVVLMYLLRLEQMIQEHGLQRSYIRLKEELRGTVRGRCTLSDYLGRNVPGGKAHIVPCRFWELRIDSDPNRALRWGVEVCRMLADWFLAPGLVERVEELWDSLAPHFSDVPVIQCHSSQVRRFPRSGRFTPYEGVFELLEFLLDCISFELVRGHVRIKGFSVQMWEVFELFVVNVLISRMGDRVMGPQVRYDYDVQGQDGTVWNKSISLDALIKGKRRFVLDAKWKEGIVAGSYSVEPDPNAIHFEDLRISNADLFQVVAYGKHRNVQAQGGILVYPVLEPIMVCRQRCILDFVESGEGGSTHPIFLIGVPVGDTLAHSLEDFVSTIRQISDGQTEIEGNAELGIK